MSLRIIDIVVFENNEQNSMLTGVVVGCPDGFKDGKRLGKSLVEVEG